MSEKTISEESNLPERRQSSPKEIQAIQAKLIEGDRRFEALEKELKANTEATQAIAINTAPLVELANDLMAGTKMLCRFAFSVKWCMELLNSFMKMLKEYSMTILLIATIIYVLTHDLKLPEWLFAVLKAMA